MENIFSQKINSKWTRLKRYIRYGYQYFCLEKRKGLDFTMRDTNLYEESDGKYHGYSKTDEKHLKEIFNRLSYEKCHNLLDIGCGKGVVLRGALRFQFKKIAGLELQEKLVKIARNNFEILGVSDKVTIMEGNALTFDKYGEYDTYFFFNPFSCEIFEKVIELIIESRQGQLQFTLIYHNPLFKNVLEKYDGFRIVDRLYDKNRNYETIIWEYFG